MLRNAIQALGWPGLLGLAALLISVVLVVLGQRWDADATRLQAQAQALRQRAPAPQAAASAPLTPQQWQASLPAATQRQQRLADLLELGLRLDLVSARTEHRLSSSEGIERLRISMPVTGSYAQLRRFVEAALAHDPALSLDALKIRRASPLATEVEAELQWSLFGKAPQ
jgi:hypothetical protein